MANAGPKVEAAAHKAKLSAHLHLSNIRDKQQDGWETPPGVLTTPKGGSAARKMSTQPSEFVDPAGASSTAQAQQQPAGGKWLGGIGTYFSAGAREERDKSFYTEERVVCFPGVSHQRTMRQTTQAQADSPSPTIAACYTQAIDALGFGACSHPGRVRS